MALKNFDIKDFMLHKGERVALYAAALFMLLLIGLGLGLHGIGSGSAASTADELNKLKQQGETAVQTSRPPEDLKNMPDELKKAGSLPAIDPGAYACLHPYFLHSALDDTKWRKPEILGPDEFQVDLVRCLVRSFIFSKDAQGKMTVMYLKPSNNMAAPKPPQQPQVPVNPNYFRFMQPGGAPGVNLPNVPPGVIPGAAPGQPADQATAQYESRFVPIDRFITKQNEPGFPAETTLPYRMVVVQAAFPYRKQLDAFQHALRYETREQMLQEANFYFRGLKVERRAARGNGPFGEWKALDIDESIRPLLTFGAEPEDPVLMSHGVVWPEDRLTVPRPMLARMQLWPAYDPKRLPSIDETIKEIDQRGIAAQPTIKLKSRFEQGFDIYKINSPDGQQQPLPNQVPPRVGGEVINKQPEPPLKCMIRFLDPSIEPGFAYEYRVKVVMDNPLYQREEQAISKDLTKEKEITAGNADTGWTVVTNKQGEPIRVNVDAEFAYYALGENYQRKGPMPVNADRTWVQVHRWFDWVKLQGADYAVGDWSIAEQLPAVRGEYIGRVEEVEVPVWEPKAAAFQFAISPERIKRFKKGGIMVKQASGIPVDFSTMDLLVDFEGGKVQSPPVDLGGGRNISRIGTGGTELLILQPDGKLVVRDSNIDYANEKRMDRVKEWQTWLDNVRKALNGIQGQPGDPLFRPGT